MSLTDLNAVLTRRILSAVQSFGKPALSGAALAGAALIAASVRLIRREAMQLALRCFAVRAEFDSRDDSYRWMLQWLTSHPQLQNTHRFSVCTTLRRVGHTTLSEEEDPTSVSLPGMDADISCAATGLHFVPTGTAVIRLESGRVCVFRRERRQTTTTHEHESLNLHILCGTRADVRALVCEARMAYLERDRLRTGIYFADEYGGWNRVASKPARPLRSVVLSQPNQAAHLLADCQRFLASEQWYLIRGIPFRRGYLLHGPPGTGKSSLVAALAGALRLDIYLVSLASTVLTDDKFAEALACAAPRCVLLLEDADAAFRCREQSGQGNSLTFSGLLNGIDGVAAQEGRLLFMTTNHPERLDEALIRPGRVDVRVPFTLCTTDQVKAYVRHFFGASATEHLVARAAAAVPDESVSVAHLQGLLMEHAEDVDAAVAHIETHFLELQVQDSASGRRLC